MKELNRVPLADLTSLAIFPIQKRLFGQALKTTAQTVSYLGVRGWILNLHRESQGVWGGVKDWLNAIFSEHGDLMNRARDQYEIELFAVFPELFGDELPAYLCLTDVAPEEEKVRSYPVDRAYRIINGLVDLITIWHQSQNVPFWLVLDHFDHAGELSQRFFLELFRRRSKAFDLRFILRIEPENLKFVQNKLRDYNFSFDVYDKAMAESKLTRSHPKITRKEFNDLVASIDSRSYVFQDYSKIIKAATQLQDEDAIFQNRLASLRQSNHFGYYEDALYHAQFLMNDDSLNQKDDISRWRVYSYSAFCLLAQNKIDEGFEIFSRLYDEFKQPMILVDICYQLAMFHTRYFQERDNEKAYDYIMEAKHYLAQTQKPPKEKIFHGVFLDNGLALIKIRMGKIEEAIELCQGGFKKLKESLGEKEHLLHRSVLNYNTAQIFSRLNDFEMALKFYNKAIDMDPNYSEYYNERGNLHQKMGQYEQALADYQQALRCSAPYSELYFNHGVCLHKLGHLPEAIASFSKSLDYNSNQPDLFHYRAVVYEEVGDLKQAIHDYRRSIEQGVSADTLAHVAVLNYQVGDLEDSIHALNHAISIDAEKPEYYYNRSVVLKEMGDYSNAVADLKKYLDLSENPADRHQVTEEIQSLIKLAS